MSDDVENTRHLDRELLASKDKEELIDLLFYHLRNYWAVDGLYFIGIEERFGTEAATEIDAWVWEVMGRIEAKKLKALLGIEGNDIPAVFRALKHSGWSLDLEFKEYEEGGRDRAIIRNRKCRVQNTRLGKGLGEFPCKKVRWGFLKSFAKEFDPDIEVKCNVCPPDEHSQDLWCEWEFVRTG